MHQSNICSRNGEIRKLPLDIILLIILDKNHHKLKVLGKNTMKNKNVLKHLHRPLMDYDRK